MLTRDKELWYCGVRSCCGISFFGKDKALLAVWPLMCEVFQLFAAYAHIASVNKSIPPAFCRSASVMRFSFDSVCLDVFSCFVVMPVPRGNVSKPKLPACSSLLADTVRGSGSDSGSGSGGDEEVDVASGGRTRSPAAPLYRHSTRMAM